MDESRETDIFEPEPTDDGKLTYHAELRKELADLELAQAMFYSNYKRDRINRLRDRLGITVH